MFPEPTNPTFIEELYSEASPPEAPPDLYSTFIGSTGCAENHLVS